jgi:hypothetical protein
MANSNELRAVNSNGNPTYNLFTHLHDTYIRIT